MTGFSRPELLASTAWLADDLGRADLRVLDLRWRPDGSGPDHYRAGHLPGAVHLDWLAELVQREDDGVIQLAGPDLVAAALGRAGVGNGSAVVLYDDALGLYAGRVWWSLRAYGLESVRILDGGYPAWQREEREIAAGPVEAEPAVFAPRANPRLRLSTPDVLALVGSPDVLVLDARAPAEYHGFEGNARRLGHIPGALNVPLGAMSQPGSQRLRDGRQLRDLVQRSGVQRERRLVCYDSSGVGAARLAFILTLLGFDDVAVYDGGWAAWGNRDDLPVDR